MRKLLYFITLCLILNACNNGSEKSNACKLRYLDGKAYKSGIHSFILSVSGDNVIMNLSGDGSNSTYTFKLKDCELQGTGPAGNATIIDDKIIFAGQEFSKQSCRVEELDGNCYLGTYGDKMHLQATTENSLIISTLFAGQQRLFKFKLNGCRLEMEQKKGSVSGFDVGEIVLDKILWRGQEWTRIACD